MRVLIALVIAGASAAAFAEPTAGGAVSPTPSPGPKMVAAFTMESQKVSTPNPHLLPEFRDAQPDGTLRAMYKICVATDGKVSAVSVMTSIGDAAVDEDLGKQIKDGWKYKPQTTAVCFAKPFAYTIGGLTAPTTPRR